jgi:flagellar basal-body rod protein FlgB
MFIERLLNQGNAPLLEQAVRFSAARQRLILDNAANVETPGYIQKDLSLARFQQLLQDRVDERRSAAPGTIRFDDIAAELEYPTRNILFHDRNNRSMEQLMSDNAKNALFHNMMVELLRKQMDGIETALKERIA